MAGWERVDVVLVDGWRLGRRILTETTRAGLDSGRPAPAFDGSADADGVLLGLLPEVVERLSADPNDAAAWLALRDIAHYAPSIGLVVSVFVEDPARGWQLFEQIAEDARRLSGHHRI